MGRKRKKPQEREEYYHAGAWSSVNVQCPFWKGETSRAVVCEGIIAGENMRRLLPSEEAKKVLMQKFCCKDYETCRIFQLLYEGYK